jgi:hypothetical protein
MTQIPAHIKALYSPPFRHSFGYIVDINGETVAWSWPRPSEQQPNSPFMTRGWSRIKYMENANALFKELDSILLAIVEPVKFDLTKCAAALTAAWENEDEQVSRSSDDVFPGHDLRLSE